jgi:hypothetical protein
VKKLLNSVYYEYRNWRSYRKKEHLIHNNIIMSQSKFKKLITPLAPVGVKGFNKIRLGNRYDGGYVMLDDFANIKAAYSLGISDDVSWDLDIAKRGIPIFQYDHTINNLPVEHPLFKFHQLGIGKHTDKERKIDTLQKIMERNGHNTSDCDLLLKIDIEGSEWETFESLGENYLGKFKQIVCEFHHFSHVIKHGWYKKAKHVFDKLLSSHRIIHVHGNNCGPFLIIGNIPFPETLEVTLVRSDQYSFMESLELFPTHLDSPNDPKKPDIFLGGFKFQ